MESPTTTFGLIEKFRQGDREAFELLFEKYRRRLAVLILTKLAPERRSIENAEEILQETFMAAFQDIGKFEYRSPGSFISWLSRIAEHVIVDMARYQGRQKRHAVALLRFRSESHLEGVDPAHTETPSRLYAQREAIESLVKKLSALPSQYRQAILLAKVEGLSTEEMAARMGKSREAAALLLHRAVRRFREIHEAP